MAGYKYRGAQKLDPDPVLPRVGPRGGRKCGTESGWARHYRAGEQACDPCREARAKARARRRGGNPNVTGRTRKVKCGTYAGATGHRRAKEPVCFACKVAEAAYRRDYEARRRGNPPEARATTEQNTAALAAYHAKRGRTT